MTIENEPKKYGCHVDVRYGDDIHDDCVLDQGKPDHCMLTEGIKSKTECKYWLPVERKMKTNCVWVIEGKIKDHWYPCKVLLNRKDARYLCGKYGKQFPCGWGYRIVKYISVPDRIIDGKPYWNIGGFRE